MSTHTISATEASRTLSNILNEVHYRGESYEIKRGKVVIAKIIPAESKRFKRKVSELNELFKRLPSLDAKEVKSFEEDIQKIRHEMNIKEDEWD